jgi:tryptophan halogenase
MTSQSPAKVVIAGNGYLPYLIALSIEKRFKHNAPEWRIVDLGGESRTELLQSLGSMRHFHKNLELPEVELVRHTRAEINLGFEYLGFSARDGEIFCDAEYGFELQNLRFAHLFNKLRKLRTSEKLEDYCLSAKLARIGRFTPPSPKARSLYASINYGYRMTGAAYAEFLKSRLSAFSERIIASAIESVRLDERGHIQNLVLQNGDTISGDFFIDASESRVLKNAVAQRQDLQPLLPADLSLAITRSQIPQTEKSITGKISAAAGILQLRGNYDGQDYLTAIATVEDSNPEITQPFCDAIPWRQNCVAMGRAFSNRPGILIDNSHIHQSALLRLLELWPRTSTMTYEARAYNTATLEETTHLRDLDALHLARAFNRAEIVSDALRYKLDIFRQNGKIAYYEHELLHEQQWPALLNALGLEPQVTDLSVRDCPDTWLLQELDRIKSTLAKAAEAAPLYRDFIRSAHG